MWAFFYLLFVIVSHLHISVMILLAQYDPNNPEASHFTQVVWKATTQVGCAFTSCSAGSVFAASFGVNPSLSFICHFFLICHPRIRISMFVNTFLKETSLASLGEYQMSERDRPDVNLFLLQNRSPGLNDVYILLYPYFLLYSISLRS